MEICADLTVNPLMVSLNQLVASRLNTLRNMKIGVVESNGEQNYVNWDDMKSYHPMNGESFTICENGVFKLDNTFYKENGGIFTDAQYYIDLIGNGEK